MADLLRLILCRSDFALQIESNAGIGGLGEAALLMSVQSRLPVCD
jgi:hypothetical protein